jgi:hypothetical protein
MLHPTENLFLVLPVVIAKHRHHGLLLRGNEAHAHDNPESNRSCQTRHRATDDGDTKEDGQHADVHRVTKSTEGTAHYQSRRIHEGLDGCVSLLEDLVGLEIQHSAKYDRSQSIQIKRIMNEPPHGEDKMKCNCE